jgi:hypothetical protein
MFSIFVVCVSLVQEISHIASELEKHYKIEKDRRCGKSTKESDIERISALESEIISQFDMFNSLIGKVILAPTINTKMPVSCIEYLSQIETKKGHVQRLMNSAKTLLNAMIHEKNTHDGDSIPDCEADMEWCQSCALVKSYALRDNICLPANVKLLPHTHNTSVCGCRMTAERYHLYKVQMQSNPGVKSVIPPPPPPPPSYPQPEYLAPPPSYPQPEYLAPPPSYPQPEYLARPVYDAQYAYVQNPVENDEILEDVVMTKSPYDLEMERRSKPAVKISHGLLEVFKTLGSPATKSATATANVSMSMSANILPIAPSLSNNHVQSRESRNQAREKKAQALAREEAAKLERARTKARNDQYAEECARRRATVAPKVSKTVGVKLGFECLEDDMAPSV